jgi:cobalt-precorrin 5A hydrolase
MERHQVSRLVIGLGFRNEASTQAIGEVLTAIAASAARPDMEAIIAVPEDKAAHPALLAMARTERLAIHSASADAMRAADARVITRSHQAQTRRNVGSVCEAAALAVAGAEARLIVTRIVSTDRHATAAAAIEDTAS